MRIIKLDYENRKCLRQGQDGDYTKQALTRSDALIRKMRKTKTIKTLSTLSFMVGRGCHRLFLTVKLNLHLLSNVKQHS